MSAAFTPGPWMVDDGDAGLWGVFQEADCDAICYLVEPGTCQTEPLRPNQAQANAHLIAAAPELYAAADEMIEHLEQAIASFEREPPDSDFQDGFHGALTTPEMVEFRNALADALAKARGSQ